MPEFVKQIDRLIRGLSFIPEGMEAYKRLRIAMTKEEIEEYKQYLMTLSILPKEKMSAWRVTTIRGITIQEVEKIDA